MCVESLRDHQADDGVAEELEALVMAARLVGVLVEPRAVDEGAREEVRVSERQPESLGELGSRARRARCLPRQGPGRGQLACSSM
jgi:hypothetical protein